MKQGSKHFRRPRGKSSKKLKQLRQINNSSTPKYTMWKMLVPKKGLALSYMMVSINFLFLLSIMKERKSVLKLGTNPVVVNLNTV